MVAVYSDRVSAYAIGKNAAGYNIVAGATEEQEEARLNPVRTDVHPGGDPMVGQAVAEKINELSARVVSDIARRIGSALPKLDFEHLIPATFLVAQFGNLSHLSQALIDNPTWLAQAPVARNAGVARMSPLKQNIQDDKKVLADGDAYILTALMRS